MVFKQHCPPVPPYLGMSLSVKGQKVHRANGGEPKQCGKKSKSPNSTGTFLQSEAEDSQSEERSEQRSECPGPAKMIGSNLEKARDDGQKRTLSTEIIEGLKKEIVRATFSIRMMNRENRYNLKRHSSEISRISDIEKDEVFKDNVILREITSEKLLNETLKNKTQKESPRNADTDDEYLVPDLDADNIDMDDFRELHDFSHDADELKEQIEMNMPKEISNSVNCTMRNLERITEVEDENSLLTAESLHSSYYSAQNKSEEDIVKESERDYVQKESSYFISMYLKPNPKAVEKMVRSPENVQGIQTLSQDMELQIIDSGTSVVSVPPRNGTEAVTQCGLEKSEAETSNPRMHDSNSTTEAGRMNDVETCTDLQKCIAQSSTQCDSTAQVTQTAVQCDEKDIALLFTRCHTTDAESFTDIDKYIIKKKIGLQKNNSLIRKPPWKISNSRSDQKKKYKNKTKKVNFVQKNIQELRDMQDRINEPVRKPSKARNTSRTAVKIIQSQDKECEEDNPKGYELGYRGEILKMLQYTRKQKLMSLLCAKEGQNFANFVRAKPVHELSETTAKSLQNFTKYKMEDIFELSGGKSDNRLEIPPICGEIASQLGLKKESLTVEVITDEEVQPMTSCSVLGSNDLLLSETIIRGITDMKVADKKKWQDSQIDWKSNVETARKACHEILSKLREFNESNSKVRLREALRRSLDNQSFGVCRGGRGLTKFGRKHLGRSQQQSSDAVLPRGSFKSKTSGLLSVNTIRRKKKMEQARADGSCSPKSDSDLAINSENGAVRKVDRTLPKIQWAFLDGHGLKSSSGFSHRRE